MIVEQKDIAKSPFVIGRAPDSDLELSHESISRHHAALYFNQNGGIWHLQDLSSTHGSKLNKKSLEPLKYYPCPSGSVLQFGASSRLIVISYPEPPAPTPVPHSESTKSTECDVNLFNAPDLFRKWLRVHGYGDDSFVIDFSAGTGGRQKNICGSWRMSLMTNSGDPEYLDITQTAGSKLEVERLIALNAIERLQRLNMFTFENGRKRKRQQLAEQAESEEDEVLDESLKFDFSNNDTEAKVLTFNQLLEDRKLLETEISDIKAQLSLQDKKETSKDVDEGDEEDELEKYMGDIEASLKNEKVLVLRKRLAEVETELDRVNEMIEIAKPFDYSDKPRSITPPTSTRRISMESHQSKLPILAQKRTKDE